MSVFGRLARRFRYLVRHDALDADMDEEVRFHIEMETDKNVRAGMSPREARRAALVAFGGTDRHKEATRAARGTAPLEDTLRDARLALRELRRAPLFAATTVLSLALAVAGTTVVASLAQTILLRPLDVPEPDRLVAVDEDRSGTNTHRQNGHLSIAYRRMQTLDEATGDALRLAGYTYEDFSIRVADTGVGVLGAVVTRGYFDVLGLTPARGRFFDPAQGGPGSPREVVLSHHYWTEALGADPDLIGRTIRLDGQPTTVVGVAPEGFGGVLIALAPELYVPADLQVYTAAGERTQYLTAFARLGDGVPLETAGRLMDRASRDVPPDVEGAEIRGSAVSALTRLPPAFFGATFGFLGILILMGVLVLVVAATNVAGMMLARNASRQRELGIRVALGAGRMRLVRMKVTESLVLFATAGVIGLLLSGWLVGLVNAIRLPFPVRIELGVAVDPGVAVISFGVAVVVGLGVGLLSGLTSTTAGLWAPGTAGARGSAREPRLRRAFVAAQIAVTVVLLFTAALFARAVQRTLRADLGMDVEGLVTAGVDPVAAGYSAEEAARLLIDLGERLRARPGVHASASRTAPLSGGANSETGGGPDGAEVPVLYGWVEGAWFEAVGTPLVAGRPFPPVAHSDGTPEAIVNEALARRLWKGRSPLGQPMKVGDREYTVVGVAENGRYRNAGDEGASFVFLSFADHIGTSTVMWIRGEDRTVAGAVRALREEMAAIDPDLAPRLPQPVEDRLRFDVAPQRMSAWLITMFGVLGLLLAALGVYGTTAHRVARRAREIGIRLALGAPRERVARDVAADGARIAGIGLVLGMVGALAVNRLVARMVYGVGLADPVVLASIPLILGVVTLGAVAYPALRATRLDPVRLLRAE